MAMDLRLARDIVDWYMGLVSSGAQPSAEIHFFGGEPFCAPEVLDLAVPLARARARESGCALRFETATNGVLDQERCRWAADNIDTIVLSLDGPPDVQDLYRPYKDGRGSFEVVTRSARILSEGPTDLYLRACVTDQTVNRMAETAAWFCQEYRPNGICFEPVQPVNGPGSGPFVPPDPWAFARNYVRASECLNAYGVETVYASADIAALQVSFCPVGRDVVIVSPGGSLDACYLLRQDWEAEGLDLSLGRVGSDGGVHVDAERVTHVRGLNVWNKPFCARCFCRWHCAGGCHVHHVLPEPGEGYDRLCIQTRAITLHKILREAIGRPDLSHSLAQDAEAVERAVLQPSDRLLDQEAWL